MLTPIPANKFSAELYSSIDYKLKFSGKPTVGYLKEKNKLIITGDLSAGLANNQTEQNISYNIVNVGKRYSEVVISFGDIDSSVVRT